MSKRQLSLGEVFPLQSKRRSIQVHQRGSVIAFVSDTDDKAESEIGQIEELSIDSTCQSLSISY